MVTDDDRNAWPTGISTRSCTARRMCRFCGHRFDGARSRWRCTSVCWNRIRGLPTRHYSRSELLFRQGIPVGIVNICFDLRRVFAARSCAADLVGAYALSFEVGVIKPDPRMFHAAL